MEKRSSVVFVSEIRLRDHVDVGAIIDKAKGKKERKTQQTKENKRERESEELERERERETTTTTSPCDSTASPKNGHNFPFSCFS